jgi:predicted nucleic acid-binding protein
LDTGVLVELARGDVDLIKFILSYDASGQAMVMPTLAVAAASLDTRSEDAADLIRGLELLTSMTVAPLNGVNQAVKLADVIAKTDLDPWDAHVAAVADAATCPILTLDGEKWRGASAALDQPLHVMEIADPGDEADPQADEGGAGGQGSLGRESTLFRAGLRLDAHSRMDAAGWTRSCPEVCLT